VERTQFRCGCLGPRPGQRAIGDRPQLRRRCLSHGAGASLWFWVMSVRLVELSSAAQCTT